MLAHDCSCAFSFYGTLRKLFDFPSRCGCIGGIAAGALQQVGEAFFQVVPQHGRSVASYTR